MQEQNNNFNETENNVVENEPFSTVFGDPKAHNDQNKKSKKHGVLKIVAGVLAVALLVGAIFGVKKWLPEISGEKTPATIESSTLFSFPQNNVKKLVINNQKGTLNVVNTTFATDIGSANQGTSVWLLEGYDAELIDSTSLEMLASASASLEVYGEYEKGENTETYGLDNPVITVTVSGEEFDDFTVSYGNDSADASYCYASLSTQPEKVYVVKNSLKATFDVSAFDLAISTGIPAVEKTDANKNYFDQEGNLISFDKIVLSGKKFKDPITFVPNNNGLFSAYATFITTTPQKRIANKAEDLRDLFGTVTSSSGCVSFDQSEESLKKFGLDDPDIMLTMTIGGQTHIYRITAQPGTTSSFYVASSLDRMIRTVPITNLPFVNKTEQEYYMMLLVLESITDVSCLEMSGDVNAKFDVSYDEDNEEYIIKNGEQSISGQDFQDAYVELISLTGIDISVADSTEAVSLTIKLHHKDESAPTVLSFARCSETRYQYYVGGVAMGQITSTAYNNLVREYKALIK